MTAECVDERDFCLVEFPARGQEATILIAIGVTEHHFLCATTTFQEAKVLRQGEEFSIMLPQLRRSAIVSNSGTMFTSSSRSRGRNSPASLSSSATSRRSETPFVFEIT